MMQSGILERWKRPSRVRSKQALSLTELLVVIAVVVILVALLLPMGDTMMAKGRQATCLSNMKAMAGVILQYSADNENRILPALSGAGGSMNDRAWYEELDDNGYFPGSPHGGSKAAQAAVWSMQSMMACPARDAPPSPYWVGNAHALHFSLNQHPGFFNRVNSTTGPWPTMVRIERPSRTFLLAESSGFIAPSNGDKLEYPHLRTGKTPEEGNGMNLVFYDGHAEYFKGRLPVLGDNPFGVNYDSIPPEDSFPWF